MEIQLIHKKVLGQIYPANQNIRIPDANMYLGISLIYSTNTSSINNSDNGFAQNFISAFTLLLIDILFLKLFTIYIII